MDVQSFRHILDLYRALKDLRPDQTAFKLLYTWFDGDEDAILKAMSRIQEQVTLAETALKNSQIPQDSIEGVQHALSGIRRVFSVHGCSSPIQSNVGNIATSITILGMLITFVDSGVAASAAASSIISEIISDTADLQQQFNDEEIDPLVREIADRHLQILRNFLEQIDVFGVEAALTTYFDLIIKVRRADVGASEASTAKTKPLWDRMVGLGKRLEDVDRIVNSGVKLVDRAQKAAGLLDYLPPLS